VLSKLSAKGIAVETSEKAKRDCRVRKLNAGRKLLAGNYSIFVSGFSDRLRSSSLPSLPTPSAPPVADGSFHSAEQVEFEPPTLGPYTPLAMLPTAPTQSFRYKKMMTESDLSKILKDVDKVPLTKSPFVGFGDIRSLSAFKMEVAETVRRRHWSAVQEFHYLSRALEESLWLMVTVQIFNDLDPQAYIPALKGVWANLDRVCGGQLEDEQLLNAMIDLRQGESETLQAFLGRVTRFRSQCQASGAMRTRDDSYFMMLSRRGMLSGDVSAQAASVTCGSWIDWVRQVIMINQRLICRSTPVATRPTAVMSTSTSTPEVQRDTPVRAVDFQSVQAMPQDASGTQHQGRQPDKRPNQRGPRRCFNCGKTDHLTRSCPLRRCWSCLSVGHSAAECPKLTAHGPKPDGATGTVRTISTQESANKDERERGETVVLPSRSVTIRAWGENCKPDGGTLTATYGGKLILKGLVDTGATDALLSNAVYDQIRKLCPDAPPLKSCNATATLANGTVEEVVGTVSLSLLFCDQHMTHDFYVDKDLHPGIIWGLRLLGRVGVTIDVVESTEGLRITTCIKDRPVPED
ncbi:hypothetical protein FOL47_002197, partial [Perkinsus chesapeaki]